MFRHGPPAGVLIIFPKWYTFSPARPLPVNAEIISPEALNGSRAIKDSGRTNRMSPPLVSIRREPLCAEIGLASTEGWDRAEEVFTQLMESPVSPIYCNTFSVLLPSS